MRSCSPLLAETERQLGHPERATELARQVLQRDESFAQARYYLALALLDLRKREEADRRAGTRRSFGRREGG